MVYESPLAYLLGIEGIGLLRGLAAGRGREFVESRITEIRALLDDDTLSRAAMHVDRMNTATGYRVWSHTYDDADNPAFDTDEPVIDAIIEQLPTGVAVDAACGTGRITRLLADRGHRVLGVDSSPDMLVRARARVPDSAFVLGDLTGLPVSDAAVDLIVCALALTHCRDLGPVMTEFSRALRPGGHLVISDMHPETVLRGWIPSLRGPDDRPARVISYRHSLGDYLRAALPVGLLPLRCEEPVRPPGPPPQPPDTATVAAEWKDWPWWPSELVPHASDAANAGVPSGLIWHFQQSSRS